MTRHDGAAGGAHDSRQINEAAAAYDFTRQGSSADGARGETTQTYRTADARDAARQTVGGDLTSSEQTGVRNRPTAATRDGSKQSIGAFELRGETTHNYSAAGCGVTRHEWSDERNWSNAGRPIPTTTNSMFESNQVYVSNSHNVISDSYSNTAYSRSNVVMMPVYYDHNVEPSRDRPIVSSNTGSAGIDPRVVVDVAMQRGIVPYRLEDETRPKVVEIEQDSRNRGVDLSARSPVGYRDFNFSSGCPDGRGPHQTESRSQFPVVPDTTRPGVVVTGDDQQVDQRRHYPDSTGFAGNRYNEPSAVPLSARPNYSELSRPNISVINPNTTQRYSVAFDEQRYQNNRDYSNVGSLNPPSTARLPNHDYGQVGRPNYVGVHGQHNTPYTAMSHDAIVEQGRLQTTFSDYRPINTVTADVLPSFVNFVPHHPNLGIADSLIRPTQVTYVSQQCRSVAAPIMSRPSGVFATPTDFPNTVVDSPAVANYWGRPTEVHTTPQYVTSADGFRSDQATSVNVPDATGLNDEIGRPSEVNFVPRMVTPMVDSLTAPATSVEIGGVGTVRGGKSSSPTTTNLPMVVETNNDKQFRPNIKLPNFNGNTSLETFLVKFNNVAQYLKWNESDKLFYICSCLEGGAAQSLWDVGSQTSYQAVVEVLKSRFGQQNQAERYRMELKARRRKPGETLQGLYQEVCRLVALAYPGEHSSSQLSALIARDAFLDALNDRDLYVRVLEKEPQTIEQALALACKLEAIYATVSKEVNDQNSGAECDARRRAPNSRHVRSLSAQRGGAGNNRNNYTRAPAAVRTNTDRRDDNAELMRQLLEQSKLIREQTQLLSTITTT